MSRVARGLVLAGCAAAAIAGCGGEEEQAPRDGGSGVAVGPASPGGKPHGGSPPASAGPVEVPGDDTCENVREPITEGTLRQAEIAIRCLTNAARRADGLQSLRFDEQLARAAATRSQDMVDRGYFAHEGPGGGDVRRAVRRTGYLPRNRSWLLAENIAWAGEGAATPARIMRSWLDSPAHRPNILSPDYREIGIGAVAGVPVEDVRPGATVTQIFGATGRAAREAQTG